MPGSTIGNVHYPLLPGSPAGGSVPVYQPSLFVSQDTTSPSTGPDPASLMSAVCQVTDYAGNLVYARSDGSVRTADSMQPYVVVGCILSKSSDTQCVVQTYGAIQGAFTHMAMGRQEYLGTLGDVTEAPFCEGRVQFVQQVGMAVKPDVIFLQPSGNIMQRDVSSSTAPGGTMSSGAQLLSGAGTPDYSLGNAGDFYIDTSADVFYGPKTAESWPLPGVSLIGPPGPVGPAGPAGPQGDVGPQGPAGKDGNYIYSGSGEPQ